MARVVISKELRALIEPQLLPVLEETAQGLADDFKGYARAVVGYGPNRTYGGGTLGPYGHYVDEVTAGAAMVRGRAQGYVADTKFTARFLERGTTRLPARHVLENFGRQSGLRFRRGRAR